MPQISVIVPVFKVEKYLKRCVDSILNQTFSELELILVDDGTPDLCGAYCDINALEDERIIVIHHQNQGQGAARNRALDISSGEWVHFVDGDDLIHPQMLEILYSAVKNSDTKISMCGYHEAREISDDFFNKIPLSTKPQVATIDENRLIEFMNDNGTGFFWIVCCKLIHYSIIVSKKIPEGHFYEDNAVASRWLHMAGKVSIIDEPLYFYQINEQGTTKGVNPNKYVDILWSLSQQVSYFKSIGYKEIAGIVLNNYFDKAINYYWMLKRQYNDTTRSALIRRKAVFMYAKYFAAVSIRKIPYGLKLIRMFFP